MDLICSTNGLSELRGGRDYDVRETLEEISHEETRRPESLVILLS